MNVKLSKPQRELLSELGDRGRNVSMSYAPAMKLVTYGFAKWERGRYGSTILHITTLGRSFLTGEPTP